MINGMFLGQIQQAISSGMTVIYQIAFVLSVVLIMGGGLALKGGRAEDAKNAIVGGIIVACAGLIVTALFQGAGVSSAVIQIH